MRNHAHTRRWLVLLVGLASLLLGLSETWQLPYMLVFLVVGVVVVNSSSGTQKITGQLDAIGGLLTVVFFSVHGSELDLNLLWDVGLIGTAYVLLRSLGKCSESGLSLVEGKCRRKCALG